MQIKYCICIYIYMYRIYVYIYISRDFWMVLDGYSKSKVGVPIMIHPIIHTIVKHQGFLLWIVIQKPSIWEVGIGLDHPSSCLRLRMAQTNPTHQAKSRTSCINSRLIKQNNKKQTKNSNSNHKCQNDSTCYIPYHQNHHDIPYIYDL